MFGVFDAAELKDIEAWIGTDESLGCTGQEGETDAITRKFVGELLADEQTDTSQACPASRDARTPRALFFEFVDRSKRNNGVHQQAIKLLEDMLVLASQKNEESLPSPLYDYFEYQPSTLRTRIEAIYFTQHKEASARRDCSTPMDREALRKALVAFSPIALIDGAWLEGIFKYFCHDKNVTDLLFKIFDEEMGNGDHRANHAKIYSKLLNSVASSFETLESLRHLTEDDIPEPVFTMANVSLGLGRFTKEFFPELLGWTLSSELVGLGGGFQYLADQLDRNGLDSSFYRVHISADNLSSGHSHMALTAMTRYMERILVYDVTAGLGSNWRRIWSGFRMYRLLDRHGCFAYS
jgi:hypothetical protein